MRFIYCAWCLVTLLALPVRAAPLVDGGFEAISPAGAFVDWSVSGSGVLPDAVFPNNGTYDAAFTDLPGTRPASVLSQVIATIPGDGYTLTLALLDEAGLAGDTFTIKFGSFTKTITGDLAAAPGTLPSFYSAFTLSIPGSATSGMTTTLAFSALIDPESQQPWNLDDVALAAIPVTPQAVPAPGGMLVAGPAFALLARVRSSDMIRRWRRRRALRRYARLLPGLLRRDFGFARYYTPAQIRSTIDRNGLSSDYDCYALAIFTEREAFEFHHAALGQTCDYAAMRDEVLSLHSNAHAALDGSCADGGFDTSGGFDTDGSHGGHHH